MEGYPALYFPDITRFEALAAFGESGCVIGRGLPANVVLPDPFCSREHLAITALNGGYQARTLSRNAPTVLNGVPLSGVAHLKHGDRLTCGVTVVIYLERDSDEFAAAQGTVSAKENLVGEIRGARQSVEIRLDRNRVIGRAPGMDGVILDHPRVSRRHAEVSVDNGRVFLRDLGSSNGTFVKGELVVGPRELHASDRIDIDPFSFTFTGQSLAPSSREGKSRLIGRGLTTTGRNAKCILENVNIVIEPGEFVCILGASGSGKSTLMKALSARGLRESDATLTGAVYLNDVSLWPNFQALKQSIALVPQRDVLYENLTLRECVRYAARLRLPADSTTDEVGEAVNQALERVGLTDRASTPIRLLSGGQKKRAALAHETVSRPDLLFLDEVTSGLDEGTDWEMMDLFRRLARHHGMTIVCVTHTVANVSLCDKIAVMTPSGEGKVRGPGLLAYYGTPAGARRWFGTENLGDVYRKLPAEEGRQWHDKYLGSEEYARYVGVPLGLTRAEWPNDAARTHVGQPPQTGARELIRQFRILTARYFRLVYADRETLKAAAGQSALIAFFLFLVFFKSLDSSGLEHARRESSLLFFLGVSCFWCGCNNASKEIVKERAIFMIERDVNLSLLGYIASKITVLSVLGVLQVALLFGIVWIALGLPDGFHKFLAMCVSVVAGTATGLFLSSLAASEDQASTMVPIALIPQILLSGVVVPNLAAVPKFVARVAISGYWVSRAMKAVLPAGANGSAKEAITILALHAAAFLCGSWWVLFRRDSQGRLS